MAESRPKIVGLAYIGLGAAVLFARPRPAINALVSGGLAVAFGVESYLAFRKARQVGDGILRPALPPSPTPLDDNPIADLGDGDVWTQVEMRDVHSIDDRMKPIRQLVRKGSESPRVRQKALEVVSRKKNGILGNRKWAVRPKDTFAEARALYEAVTNPNSDIAIRYTKDHIEIDQYSAADKTLFGVNAGDCLPADTLLMTPSGYKRIADVVPGDTIMGDGDWVEVTNWWDKGDLPVIRFRLSNGGTFECTADHKVFVIPKTTERRAYANSIGYHPQYLRENAIEKRGSDVVPGDRLLHADVLPEGTESLSFEDAWLLGLYVADGWVDYNENGVPTRVSISGQDGQRKEKNKSIVREICEMRGWTYNWNRKYIRINNPRLAQQFAQLGRRAAEKRLPHTNWTRETARWILGGLSEDASVRNKDTTFGTTSYVLALQIRALYRMLGARTSLTRVDNHGGFGENAIYRLIPAKQITKDGSKPIEAVKVKSIEQGPTKHVYDIETSSHRFYLPEHDIIVHNCDDSTIALGAMLRSIGHDVKGVVMGEKGKKSEWTHILLADRDPKTGRIMFLDPSVENKRAGWAPPGLEQCLRTGKPVGKVARAAMYDF